MLDTNLSVSRVAELTGAKPRAIQYWVEHNIVRPDIDTVAAGRGVHRIFSADEARIAAIAALLPFNMSAPLLRAAIEYLRPVVLPGANAQDRYQVRAAKALSEGQQILAVISLQRDADGTQSVNITFWTEEDCRNKKPQDLFGFHGAFVGVLDIRAAIEGIP